MWKSVWRAALACGLALSLSACNLLASGLPGGQTTTISGPPVVRLAAPLPNATYLEGVAVNIQAQISNAGQDISRVEIVVDGTIVAPIANSNAAGAPAFTVSHSWPATGVGQHTISVTAFRSDGLSSAPATVNISVVGIGSSPSPTPTTAAPPSIGNEPPPGVQAQPTAAPTNSPPPTEPPPPTNTPTPSKPVASFNQGVNVRSGPSTLFNPPIGSFAANQTTDILGRTPDGSWYKVRYYNAEGWVFGQLLTVSGDASLIPIDPGPPTPTLTPTPVPMTPTPTTNIDLVAGSIRLEPAAPKCNQTFNVFVDVANFGTGPVNGGSISVQDIAVRDGTQQQATSGAFGTIQPGQTVNSGAIPITVSTYFNERHKIVVIIDPANQIPETNEGNNRAELEYTLDKGSC